MIKMIKNDKNDDTNNNDVNDDDILLIIPILCWFYVVHWNLYRVLFPKVSYDLDEKKNLYNLF